MALIYDEIRGWHVVDDEPDGPPTEVSKPTFAETLWGCLGVPIIIDYSFDTNQIKDEKNP